MPLSITGLNDPVPLPAPKPKVTVRPPDVRWLPAASSACNVTVVVLPDATVPGDTLTNDFDKLTGPVDTVMDGAVEVTSRPPIVDVIVLLPARIPVKVAV